MRKARTILFLALVSTAMAQPPRNGEPKVHDPSTPMEEKGDAWCFSTGNGVLLLQRQSDGTWKRAGSVFDEGKFPAWHKEEVPENRGHLWAPDVIRVGDRWLVYYSVSSFGKNRSAIGLASGETLDPKSTGYGWKDEGVVIRSGKESNFNAIDPALILDGKRLWMSFGSFWDGIMLVELDPKTGLMKDPEATPLRLAHHAEIEAPFIHNQDGWYYLFVNHGLCCRGEKSTYEIRVGRSRKIEGPYQDLEKREMNDGGGTLLLGTEGSHIGPGHASIYQKSGRQWMVHHFYDGEDRGRSKLRMLPLEWKDGWPVIGK